MTRSTASLARAPARSLDPARGGSLAPIPGRAQPHRPVVRPTPWHPRLPHFVCLAAAARPRQRSSWRPGARYADN